MQNDLAVNLEATELFDLFQRHAFTETEQLCLGHVVGEN